jgi:TonB family protein
MNKAISQWLKVTAVACLFAYPSNMALSQSQEGRTVLDDYKLKTADKVKSAWTVPNVGFAACVLGFKLAKDGSIAGLKVEDSSGMPDYDKSCLDAIGSTSPFSQLPQGIEDEACVARFVTGGGNTLVNIGMFSAGSKAHAKSSAVSLESYQTDLQHQITSAWNVPTEIKSCQAYYTFKINKGGGVSDTKVIDASGVDKYDKSCKAAIVKATPFSPLPKGVSSLTVNAHFDAAGQGYHITVLASPAVPTKSTSSPTAATQTSPNSQ